MVGVTGTRYLLPIPFCSIRTKKMSVKNAEKVIKKYFRIPKKSHAYLQAILKAHVKFQKDRPKLWEELRGQSTCSLYTSVILELKKCLKCVKSDKKIISGF